MERMGVGVVVNFKKQLLPSNADAGDIVRVFNQQQTSLDGIFSDMAGQPQFVRLTSITLATGANLIPTTLGRRLSGWIPTRVRSAATVSDDQDNNTNPAYLKLVASAPVVVDLLLF